MRFISVQITAFVDDHQPGFVECGLTDAQGQVHRFIEKAPVVSRENLWSDSDYPRPGLIGCEVEAEWTDEAGRALAKVSTELPWHIESVDGVHQFTLLTSQLT
jgi:hypothetical protein